MLIVEVDNRETIDRAIKRYRRKHKKTRLVKELRRRKEFQKPSVRRRAELLKAKYKRKKGMK
jgi:small subunit ribosomal protein S21